MNQTKFDRREKRKALQRDEKKQRHEAKEKLKLNKDNNPNGKPYKKIRKLKDGGIAFGKNYKIGRSGQAGFLILGILAIVMYMGFTGMYDDVLPLPNKDYDYVITDDMYKTWVPLNEDGTQMTDSSGNVIKFTNENTYREFLKRISAKSIILQINNFFFHNYLMPTQ